MHLLLDHLSAIVVGGAILLLLAATGLSRAEGVRDSSRSYAHQRGQASFTEVLERDLTDLGIGTPAGAAAIVTATTTEFSFYGIVDRSGTVGLISYVETPAGSVDGSPVVRVERRVDGSRTGGASAVFNRFDFAMLSDTGTAVASPSSARQVRVEAEWVLPHTEAGGAAQRQSFRRSSWSTTLRPLGLQP